MTEQLTYERFLYFKNIMETAVSRGRMNKVAARDGLEHVKISTERGNHTEARLYADSIIESLADA